MGLCLRSQRAVIDGINRESALTREAKINKYTFTSSYLHRASIESKCYLLFQMMDTIIKS
jgi:hypothetical protein